LRYNETQRNIYERETVFTIEDFSGKDAITMKRLTWWYSLIGLLAVILVGGIVITQQATASSSNIPRAGNYHTPDASTSVRYMPGGPAITVSTSTGASTTEASTNYTDTSLTPAFTKSDVETFLNKYGFYAGPLVQGTHLKILTIQFVTAKQASTLMAGESVGRPDNYLVCYVKVQGPFQLTQVHAGPHLPGMKKTRTTAEIGDMVFDAHTGNVLVWGVY
jgi:hypothetical protein